MVGTILYYNIIIAHTRFNIANTQPMKYAFGFLSSYIIFNILYYNMHIVRIYYKVQCFLFDSRTN